MTESAPIRRCELRSPTSPDEWTAYHAIRREVLFERRGHVGTYDANHPDEHRAGNYPKILVHEGRVVAVIRIDLTPPVATFRRVAVREDAQRLGHGRQLLQLAEAFAAEHGCSDIVSSVDEAAIGFYLKCGFVRAAGHNPDKSAPMTKRLVRL